jgi:ubiquinone/menaquinone biosynthesis C-methylase UbiE
MKNNYWKKYWESIHNIDSPSLQVQVARTRMGNPIDQTLWLETLRFVEVLLDFKKEDVLLDACGGNGLFASRFQALCKRTVVVDINAKLLENLAGISPTITTVHAELTEFLENNDERFDKILFYAGIQYFSEQEVFKIFASFRDILKPGGIILIGDIPDFRKRDSFLADDNRFERYFENFSDGAETIGTWFTFEWISALSDYLKFKSCNLIVQPEYQIYSDFRFDAIIRL